MAGEEKSGGKEKKSVAERFLRFGRNVSFLGGIALAGAAYFAPPAAVGAGLAIAAGAGFELARERSARRRQEKQSKD